MTTKLYFEFLCKLVGNRDQYGHLLDILYRMEFYSLVPNDDNRGVDGEYFRRFYLDDIIEELPSAIEEIDILGPCTLLEMLIGVAYRLEFELLGGRYEKTADYWFWVLIDNLGLMSYTNEKIHNSNAIFKVEKILTDLLERRYDTNGEGGLFPLKYPEKDQRRVEIWYQMSAWVIENYPI